jgi:DNA-binding MarR family transcriptional regulator
MDTENFKLDESLGFIVSRAALAMRRAFDQQLARHNLTTSQWSIMARLAEEEGLTQMELGRRSLFDRPTTTGILARLEERGLIERRRSATDTRARAIYFTPTGRALFRKLPPLAATVNATACKHLSAAEQRQLASLLNKVSSSFDH